LSLEDVNFTKSKIYTNFLNQSFTVPPYGVKSYIFKLSKNRNMTITKNTTGLKYHLLLKEDNGSIGDNNKADKIMISSDKDKEYFVVFVNDSEKDISGDINISSSFQNTTSIQGNITLPDTAGDLNFVFLSKDTKTAFVLTKNYIDGSMYLYRYDISNPKEIKLQDNLFLAGNNIRYIYDGIYLSKDKSKLYILITDHRHGDDRFFVIDISPPSALNKIGEKFSEQNANYFSYNLLSKIEGFSADETKVYFSSFIKEFASSEPQKDMLYLEISDLSNMNAFSGVNDYTLAGHEPQSSVDGVTVTVQNKRLIVERLK
jgi:hypothetical protein